MSALPASILLSTFGAFAFAGEPATPSPEAPLGPRRASSVGPISQWFSSDDYPLDPLRRDVEGTVGFRVEVNSRGEVSDCAIVATSGNSDLDIATCRIVRERGRFRPALDSEGRPLPDSVTARVTCRIDREAEPWAFEPSEWITTVRWSDPDPVCTQSWNGEPPGPISAAECLEEYGDAMIAVRNGRGAFELSFVSRHFPENQLPMTRPALISGERVWFEEVEIAVTPRGEVESCRLLAGDISEALPLDPAASTCAYYETEARFDPVPGNRLRRLRAINAVYMKVNAVP